MKRAGAILLIVAVVLFAAGLVSAASFLEDEAGISASIQVAGVDLSLAETAFKNIEKKTASYIIGSVAIDGYGEDHDVHVYVDSGGHMVAYYLNTEEASKIIDWVNYTGGSMTLAGCKLEDALTKVCVAMFLNLPAVTYFDFRFPNAENIKIIVDEQSGDSTDTFNLQIPGTFIVYNRAYSHAAVQTGGGGHNAYVYIDDVLLNHLSGGGWRIVEGQLDAQQLSPDVSHEIKIVGSWTGNSYIAIVLQYTEP